MTRLSNNDINQLKSYTEVVTTGNTALVAVSFDYAYGKDGIVVTIDAKDPSTMGYTVTMPNENTVSFNPPVPTGHTIRLQRETNIDKMEYIFTSGALFIASNMDANFEKIRHSQQDVRDAFNVLRNDFISVNATSNTALNAANTAVTAANLSYSLLSPFIVRGALSVYTKAQIDALIATGGTNTVLSIASGGTGATTAEEARANLGVYSTSYVDNVTAQATETTLGTAKIATVAQAKALTNDETIMTPAKIHVAFNAVGEAPLYACRAWVNFSGNTLNKFIRASGNILSITDNGVGTYALNLITPMVDTNFVVTGIGSSGVVGNYAMGVATFLQASPSIVNIQTWNASTVVDYPQVHIAIFR